MFKRIVAAGFLILSVVPTQAADFYQGKTVTLINSEAAGTNPDLIARTFAVYLPRHLPGQPKMIVQDMPGAGNLLATNHLYNVAPKDGTVIAALFNSMPLYQVTTGESVRFNASKFNWLGSTGASNLIIFVMRSTGVQTVEDAKKKEVLIGATGAGSSGVIYPTVSNRLFGTKFKVLIGYGNSGAVNIALQRGEIDGRSWGYLSLAKESPDWIKQDKVAVLFQVGAKRDRNTPDAPLMTELAKTDEERQVLRLISSPSALGKPYAAPPGLLADRVAVLRTAFMATMQDKAFAAEMKRLNVEFNPISGVEVQQIVNDTVQSPPALIQQAKALMDTSDTKK
jgi:tripartite-type tricarboxylate transporter receptor subunit TctC